jgi:hypothetical protein
MKPRTFGELFTQAEQHEDYWAAGVILEFTESVVREMERQGISRTELAKRIGATPAYVTKILPAPRPRGREPDSGSAPRRAHPPPRGA